jgi:hypothetical protein
VTELAEVALPKAVSELRMAQEQGAIEGSKDVSKLRHEVRRRPRGSGVGRPSCLGGRLDLDVWRWCGRWGCWRGGCLRG